MKKYFDQLNLRPNERRLVVFVAVVVFVVLNIWLVWPHFGDWSRTLRRLHDAQGTLVKRGVEVNQLPEYERRVHEFERENPTATRDDQSIEMLRVIQDKAFRNSINIASYPRPTTVTNDFFVEQIQQITLQSPEDKLVDFLYDLGTGESTIRVREFSLRPDGARQQLGGNLKLVASYQRKMPTKPAPAAVPPAPAKTVPAPASNAAKPAAVKPATNPAPAKAAATKAKKS